VTFTPRERESVLFPAPFEPGRRNPVIISTLRVVQETSRGPVELAAINIRQITKQQARPLIVLGLLLVFIALPLIGYAVISYVPVRDLPSFAERPPLDAETTLEDPHDVRMRALGFAIAGVVPAFIGLVLIRKKRFLVYCHGQNGRLRLIAKNAMQQDQWMTVLQSVQQTAKLMAQATGG
jgi:hypothetical protein